MSTVNIGEHVLYHGDCLDFMAQMEPGSVDAVVCDPPYGIAYVANGRKTIPRAEMLANDAKPRLEFVPPIVRVVKDGGAVYLCTRFDVAYQWVDALEQAGAKVKNPVYWIKDNLTQGDLTGDRGNCVEIVLFAHVGRHLLRGKRTANAWNIPRPPPCDHPTPKPVELMERLILQSSDIDDTIFDPFMGTCATGAAAVKTGRKFIGCELEPKYFNMSRERFERDYHDAANRLPGLDPVSIQKTLFA